MFMDRNILEKYLYEKFSSMKDSGQKRKFYLSLLENYNIPISMSTDIFSLRRDLGDYSEFILFCVLDTVKKSEKEIEKYYTEKEIKNYRKSKYEIEEIKFPIKFDVVQVTEDQWIGATTFKNLMKLRDAQLINYNENTQRTLKRRMSNDIERFEIALNKAAVKSIRSSIEDKIFIPNTITLNIQKDDEKANFVYQDNELIVKDITAFDITDGYHRYIAFGQVYDLDNSADYPIEIRITNFVEGKANQFIFQEDQKTPMKRTDSNSHNQFNPGNQIVERINIDKLFNLSNEINNTDGVINFGVMSLCINSIWFDKNKPDKKQIIEITKKIRDGINDFTENYEEYLSKKWNYTEIIVIMYGIYNNYSSSEIYDKLQTNTLGNNALCKFVKSGRLVKKKTYQMIEEAS